MSRFRSRAAFVVGVLLPLMLVGPIGCGLTSGLWRDADSGRVYVNDVSGFLLPDPPDADRPPQLVVRCEGDGLNRGTWFVTLPLDADLRLPPPAGRPSLEGLGSDEIWRVLNRTDAASVRRAYAGVRPLQAYSGPQQGYRFVAAPRSEVRLARGFALLAYWPSSADLTATRYVVPADPARNLVEVVVFEAAAFDPVPRVAALPPSFQRSRSGRTANVAAAVALTPLAVVGDATGAVGFVAAFVVGTALLGPPILIYFAVDAARHGGNDRLSRLPRTEVEPSDWHPPLAWPPVPRTPGIDDLPRERKK